MSDGDSPDPLAELSDREVRKLRLIASKGRREMILWECASDGRTFLGVDHTAGGLGSLDAPLEQQVEEFVGVLENEWDRYAHGTDFEVLEQKYGGIADAIIAEQR